MIELKPIYNLFAVEVPEGSRDHGLVHIYAGEDLIYWYDANGEKDCKNIDVNAHTVETLFTTRDCTIDQCRQIVDADHAVEAIQSLLRAAQLDLSKNYLLLRKRGIRFNHISF